MFNQFILLFFINNLSSIGYSIIAPLYPPMAESRGIDEFTVGLVFSTFAISNVLTIPFSPNIVQKLGRKNSLYYALFLESICTIIFGSINCISNKNMFIFISLVFRFLHGFGSALSSTLVYSIAASLCDDENIKSTMGYMELSYSIGLTLGPLFASFLYYINGYSLPFIICGLFMLICMFMINSLYVNDEEIIQPNFFTTLMDIDILITFLAIVVDMITTTFIYPVFAIHLNNTFGLSVEKSSVFFVINMMTYFITLQFLNKLSDKIGIKYTMILGLFINSIAVLFLAPCSFLPQNIFIVIFGLVILGMTGACITIPAIIDFIETLRNKFNLEEGAANDLSSALYNFGVNVGEMIGPALGGAITKYKNFEFTCYYTSFFNIVYVLIFYIYGKNKEASKIEKSDDFLLSNTIRKLSVDNISIGNRIRSYSVNTSRKHSFNFN